MKRISVDFVLDFVGGRTKTQFCHGTASQSAAWANNLRNVYILWPGSSNFDTKCAQLSLENLQQILGNLVVQLVLDVEKEPPIVSR